MANSAGTEAASGVNSICLTWSADAVFILDTGKRTEETFLLKCECAVASIAGLLTVSDMEIERSLSWRFCTVCSAAGLTDTNGKTTSLHPTLRCEFSTIPDNPGELPLTCNPTRVQT